MRVIDTQDDLRRLAEDASLPGELRDCIEDLYWSSWHALGSPDRAAFGLATSAPIAILGRDDRTDAVPGCCQKTAEWADALTRGGGLFFDVGVLEGNDRLWRLFGLAGELDPAVEEYLRREVRGLEER